MNPDSEPFVSLFHFVHKESCILYRCTFIIHPDEFGMIMVYEMALEREKSVDFLMPSLTFWNMRPGLAHMKKIDKKGTDNLKVSIAIQEAFGIVWIFFKNPFAQ